MPIIVKIIKTIKLSICIELKSTKAMAKLRSILIAFLILLPPSCHPKHTIIAVLELEHTSTDLPTLSWERGLEILPGAQVAIEHINHYYNISQHQFELEVINSGKCSTENYKEDLIIDFLNLTRHRNSSQFALIGLFCSSYCWSIGTDWYKPCCSIQFSINYHRWSSSIKQSSCFAI